MQRTLIILAVAALALAGCATEDDSESTASPTPSETASPTPGGDEPDDTPSPTPADDETDPDQSPSPSDGDDVAAMDFTDCQSEDYTVAYPGQWDTNEASDLVAACRVFHPDTVDLPDDPQGIGLQWAAMLNIDNVPYDDVIGGETTGEVLQERETTIDGRDANVIEIRSAGEALVPEGETRYGYAIDLDGRTLFASTYSVGDTNYERDKQVLDRMLESLQVAATE